MHDNWLKMYEFAQKYYWQHKDLEIKIKYVTEEGIKLGMWISNQRKKYKNGKLSHQQIEMLNSIGMIWKVEKQTWDEMYSLAENYYRYYHNLKISKNFITKNGYEYDQDGLRLGLWIFEQRKTYKKNKISKERIEKLNKIGMIWEANKDAWQKMYELAAKYYEKHKNLKIPIHFKTKDGFTYDAEGIKLGIWIGNQRQIYNSYKDENRRQQTLSSRQIYLLNDIGMIWDASIDYDKYWNEMYNLAQKYYYHYKKLDIPIGFRTKDGVVYDKKGYKLGKWIQSQRRSFKAITNPTYAKTVEPLSRQKQEKLEKIGMIWNIYDYKWYHNYEIVKKYYMIHGNLEVTPTFRTKDGKTYDEAGLNIYNWLSQQRQAYKHNKRRKLSEEQISLLNEINMIWDVPKSRGNTWTKFYSLAEKYYNHHHNLDIKTKFKTKNGYEHDEEGEKLGAWIKKQRYNYKNGILTDEQIKLLNNIEMIWRKMPARAKNEKFKNVEIDKGETYRELVAKINLLRIMGLPLIIDNKPNPIIYMTDSELKKNLNISIEDLIYNFYSEEKSEEVKQTIKQEKNLSKRLIK